jgi:hypothetical protein
MLGPNGMAKLVHLPLGTAVAIALLAACGRDPLTVPSGDDGQGGAAGTGGAGGTVILRLPDGGLSGILGDGGVLGGILDAPRDSLLGQVFCGPEARLGAKCGSDVPGCLLPSLGGACACINGTYLCPLNPAAGPQACPTGAATGKSCMSPLSVCIGGAANACICGLGSYTCF